MVLVCESSVVDRRIVKSAPVPYSSTITLVEEEINFQKYLYLKITKIENGRKLEDRYQLLNNIQKLDKQHVNANLLLIRLRNPKYDIFIKCDKKQLNFFLRTLRAAIGTRMGNQPNSNRFVSTSGTRAHFKLAGPAPASQAPSPIAGIGLKLLQNMGWKPGEGLGKDKTGTTEPLLLEHKTDKIGLYTSEDNTQHLVKGPQATMSQKKKVEITFEGKHPVSQLCEIAAQNKWNSPEYEITELPDKKFFFRVTVNGIKYESKVDAVKKKDAKLFAAQHVLKILGPLEEHKATSSTN